MSALVSMRKQLCTRGS